MNSLQEYQKSFTVPSHPKSCPDCGSKVAIYNFTLTKALFLCSQKSCIWPLETREIENIVGSRDLALLTRIQIAKRRNNNNNVK